MSPGSVCGYLLPWDIDLVIHESEPEPEFVRKFRLFQTQQTLNDLQKAREEYLSILEKGKQLGFHEETHST